MKEVLMDNDNVSGYDVPVDPMDLLQCDSCQ
ncbi:ribonucleotide-diphosphate reductase subunit beta [Salinibacterium sp. SYSU T00001]|nr:MULTISPECIES: ribonucleotide-diphosphate reductase subunit beta [Salinibacterium]MCW4386007.1 ribonucleotide-diphosphate reductase subunit beta [Salinibacterium sedimenticola]